ncbi:unnamed protein product [Rotaria magnacalcarata]|uniref:DED domain-containing protein n=1 Tax=Rotaria magnacalcarata TaxID=392030 RepID=A0A816PRW6_9BILA|nr:unnamed protein product [Rotaria magnacalcarata]
MNAHRLRAILLKLQDRLTDDDRKRLHFFFGNDVPRRIRDDPSLGGTLSLMEFLFDQDKINEEDFTFLINAFEAIQCVDAAKLLRGFILLLSNNSLFSITLEHMRQIKPSEIKPSMKSLVEILPITMKELFDDQEDDKYGMEFREWKLFHASTLTSFSRLNLVFLPETNANEDNNNTAIIDKDDKNINSITTPTDDQTRLPLQSKWKPVFNATLIRWICLFLISMILIIIFGVVSGTYLHRELLNNDRLKEKILAEREKCNETIQRLINQLKSSEKGGVTVAGGNGKGNATNQLLGPSSFCVEDDQTVIITDTDGKVVAGGNGSGERLNQLYYPTNVLIDKTTDSLIICDWINQRVVRWHRHSSTTQGEAIIGQIDCYGLAMNDQKYLYVSNTEKHEVRRYQSGDRNGTLVAGGNGKGAGLNQLDDPRYVFVDQKQNVYVSDKNNHRVMKWTKYATEGIIIAGGKGRGSSSTQLHHPGTLFVDTLSTVYVADSNNQRVMRWPQGAIQGSVIVGENGEGAEANQFSSPIGVSFDQYGNLYVADEWNHRVQRFPLE